MSRPAADQIRAARDRVALMNRRGAQRLAGVRVSGRVAGRLAQDLPPLPADTDLAAPALTLLLLPVETAERVLEAAAAALVGHDLAQAITPVARAAQAGTVSDEARHFALHHRHLSDPASDSAPAAEGDLAARLDRAQARIRAAWRSALPAPLAQEFGAGDPPPEPEIPLRGTRPVVAPMPESAPSPFLRWRRRKSQVLPPAQARPVAAQDRPQAAFHAALTAFSRHEDRP